MDEEGLKILKWSMFDSPDSLGSGKRFMESEPVFILDTVFRKERLKGYIHLGYTSKAYADRIGLGLESEHRIGKAIKFKCINPSHRFRLVRGLIQYGDLQYRQAVEDAERQANQMAQYEPLQRLDRFGQGLTGVMGGLGSVQTQEGPAAPVQSGLSSALNTGIGALSLGKLFGMK